MPYTTIDTAIDAWDTAVADIEGDYPDVPDCDVAHAAYQAVVFDCTPQVAQELRARLGY
jgi:hypothetical protein